VGDWVVLHNDVNSKGAKEGVEGRKREMRWTEEEGGR
jgi:hypothetical protein